MKKLVKKQKGGTTGRIKTVSENGNYKTIEKFTHSSNKNKNSSKTTRTLIGILRGVPKPDIRGEKRIVPSTPGSIIVKKGGQIKKKK